MSERAYKIRALTAAGALKAEVTDFLWLGYTRTVGLPGNATFALPQDHALTDALVDRDQIEIWRRDPDAGLDWYRDFSGLYLVDRDREQTDVEVATLYAAGDLIMLSWRYVLWLAGTANRSRFDGVPAETVAKTLVTYNATAAATTAAGRQLFSGAITHPGTISVEADGGGGNAVNWGCSWANLLDTLHDLAQIAGGDYDLVKTGANAWEFRWYAGQLGTDRSASVIFSDTYDNLANIRYEERQSQRVTGVVVGGPGEGDQRQLSSAVAAGWSQDSHVEAFLNRTNLKTDAERQDAGNVEIYLQRAQRSVSADVVQTAAVRYGRDYQLGDLVTRNVYGISETVKIRSVIVACDQDGQETITPEFVVV